MSAFRHPLVLQLTSVVETFMRTKPKEGEPPIVAQIHMGRLGRILNEKLQTLLDVAHYDPHLDLAAATGALLETAADLNARLIFYTRYRRHLLAPASAHLLSHHV